MLAHLQTFRFSPLSLYPIWLYWLFNVPGLIVTFHHSPRKSSLFSIHVHWLWKTTICSLYTAMRDYSPALGCNSTLTYADSYMFLLTLANQTAVQANQDLFLFLPLLVTTVCVCPVPFPCHDCALPAFALFTLALQLVNTHVATIVFFRSYSLRLGSSSSAKQADKK